MSKPEWYRTVERQLMMTRAALGVTSPSVPAAAVPGGGGDTRGAWVYWVAPRFSDNDSAYFTFTYSDEYGYSHGCMLTRNVQKDVRRFIRSLGLEHREWISGVEPHRDRAILHAHGILQGPFSESQRAVIRSAWAAERGHAKVLPVTDRCASYVTKYALKGDTDAFDWNLS